MNPIIYIGDPRHKIDTPLPDWFVRDMGDRIYEIEPRRWHLPIWPGFRLELRIYPINGVSDV